VNLEALSQRFNEVTEALRGQIVRAKVTVYKDRSFAVAI
jgi:ribosomal protein L11